MGGNSQSGIDCSAYVQKGYRELFGVDIPRTVQAQRMKGEKVARNELATGDLVFFRPESYPHHVGIYLGDGTFIHVSSSKGVTRSKLRNVYWRRHYNGARRVLLLSPF